MYRAPIFRRFFRFFQFLFGGRYSLLWLALTLLGKALLRRAEEVAAPPNVLDKAVDAATAEHEREALNAAWELAKDIDVSSKGWYGRLRKEWETTRTADASQQRGRSRSLWSSELRTLGKLVSRRFDLLKQLVPRSVVRPFLFAAWAGVLSLAIFLFGFFAVVLRFFAMFLPEAHRSWVAALLGGIAMSALPLTAMGLLVVIVSLVRGVTRVIEWLRQLVRQF